jgi:stress response protein YsnF
MDSTDSHPTGGTIPVLEEVATVSKRTVTTGFTTVEKRVESHNFQVSETLEMRGASIERLAIGTEVDSANPPQIRIEEGVTIIPVLEEILVVEKRLILKEELRIRHHVDQVLSTQEITLRTETVIVGHRDADPGEQVHRNDHNPAFDSPLLAKRD